MIAGGREAERGHLMVGLMAVVAILLIGLTVAEQAWHEVLRRDKEAEMIFRAKDVVRALRRYQQDQGGQLPSNWEDLAKQGTKGQYFIRKLWKDPLVKDGKWCFLFALPQGGVFDPCATVTEGEGGEERLGSSSGSQPRFRGTPRRGPGGGGFGGGRLGGDAPVGGGLGGGLGGGAFQETGGMPIAGVKSLCKDKPFRVIQDETEYANWLFSVFDPEPDVSITAQGGAAAPPKSGTPRTRKSAVEMFGEEALPRGGSR